MGGGFYCVVDGWVKTHQRDVFSSGTNSMLISQAIMKKLFFENFENVSFWAIFIVF